MCVVHFSLYLYCNNKIDMIMKTEKIFLVLRISNFKLHKML
nr:MAG TPA: hypothetical protein [Microviridae sp.]